MCSVMSTDHLTLTFLKLCSKMNFIKSLWVPDSKMVSRHAKMCIVFLILCTFLTSVYYRWPRQYQTVFFTDDTIKFSHNNNTGMIILVWYWPFGQSYPLEGDVCWDRYKVPQCKLVDQRSYFPSADVVVFHNRELIQGGQSLPVEQPRPQGQRWAWVSLESPDNNGNLQNFANMFNMTVSYRRDADVTVPYGVIQPREAGDPVVEERPVNKTFFACWVVSNYQDNHKRSHVYKELSAVVPVQVYGHWTNKPLSSSDLLATISQCYFYLAFENSVAQDYITEKLWYNGYEGGAVPVVLGPSKRDYSAVAPNHSFIHVDDFKSVKEMGMFLLELSKDQKRYNEYFTWKQKWKVKRFSGWNEAFCSICKQINSLPEHKVYSDLQAWDKMTLF